MKHLWDGDLMVSRERGPAEPRSMYSWSRRQRERDRRCAILQAQAKSYVLKRLLWHRPRDDVAGATGQGVVDEKFVGQEASPTPFCYTGLKFSETVKLKNNTFDAALSSCTSSKLKAVGWTLSLAYN